MKTFADINTKLQQEAKHNVTLVQRVELLHQYGGKILSRDSATQITMAGNASSILSVGDTFVIPLDDFEIEHVITSLSYFAALDYTLLSASASNFSTTVANLYVAKKIIVSYGNTERLIEMSPIRYQVEGETLTEWLASDVEFVFENGDGYFANSGATGLFDNSDIFWVRIFLGFKKASDRLLWFGGTVDRESIVDNRAEKTFSFVAQGHLKELERYPGWAISDTSLQLLAARGFDILAVTATGTVQDGIRKLKMNWPDKDFLSGLVITAVSKETKAGLHVIKFRPPDLFQYDYGTWTAMTLAAEDQTLTAADGHTVTFNVPRDFDVVPRYLLFSVENDEQMGKVTDRGTATLEFGNGPKQDLLFDFSHILDYDGSTYSDITFKLSNDYNVGETLLNSGSDVLYFISPTKFDAIDFTVKTSDLVGTLVFEYSQGFSAWATISVTDATSGLITSGRISWNVPADWHQTDLELGGSIGTIQDVYVLRIRMSSYTSGSSTVTFARRALRVTSDEGISLDLKTNLQSLQPVRFEEDILITSSGGTISAANWQNNIPVDLLLKNILDAANYTSAKRTVDALEYSLSSPAISSWFQAPVPGYKKPCTAIVIDTSTSPETLYLGVGDELWKVTEKTGFQYLDRIPGNGDYELEIFRLAIDGNGYLHGVARKRYDRVLVGSNLDAKRTTPAVVFRSTDKVTITESALISSRFYSGEVCYRNTKAAGSGGRVLGQGSTEQAGENVTTPYPELLLFFSSTTEFPSAYKVQNLTSSLSTTTANTDDGLRPFGWWFLSSASSSASAARFELGQPGFCLWDEEGDRWFFMYWELNSNQLRFVDYTGTYATHLTVNNDDRQILAACDDGAGNAYLAEMTWDNSGGTFPADLSDCRIVKVDMSLSGSYTAVFDFATDSVESGQSLSGNNDAWPKLRSCTVTDLCFNSAENTLHGCILDRYTLQHHWFVYDITADKLYSTQTGSGFDYNEGMQLAGFVYNSNDQKVYAVAQDRRYNDLTAYLIAGDFDSSRSAGSEIVLSKLMGIAPGETRLKTGLVLGSGGRIYGVSGNLQNALWQYDSTFYPRIAVADLTGKNLREVMTDCSQVVNRTIQVRANRKIRVVSRDQHAGEKSLFADTHVLSVEPLQKWQHFYDRVEVAWQNKRTDQSGTAAYGDDGWERRILTIQNGLIQSSQLAGIVAEDFFTYFNAQRDIVSAVLALQLELEEYDRVRFYLNTADTDISRNDWFKLMLLELDTEAMTLQIQGLQ